MNGAHSKAAKSATGDLLGGLADAWEHAVDAHKCADRALASLRRGLDPSIPRDSPIAAELDRVVMYLDRIKRELRTAVNDMCELRHQLQHIPSCVDTLVDTVDQASHAAAFLPPRPGIGA